MKTTPGYEKLLDLVDMARKGRIALPQFQRNFVWSAAEITDLLVSIFQGYYYYIGTFLLLRTDPSPEDMPFAIRPLEGIKIHAEAMRPDRMILDGQQRLTSLHYVFAAPQIPLRWTKYPYRFFLDLRQLAAEEFEKAISWERSDYVGQWLSREKQYQELIIPFTEIENWSHWLKGYEDWILNQGMDGFNEYRRLYRDSWAEMIERIRGFQVTTIEIDKIAPNDPEQIAQVCAIFEKMNSTGTPLSVYDLLTARMYRFGIDMHTLWQQSVDNHSLLNVYSEGKPDNYGVFLLRVIALLRGFDVKGKTLINLAPENFAQDWQRAALYMEKALQRMVSTNADGFGVFNAKWMPYATMISPMAALLAQIDEQKLDHRAYKLLRKWYWSSALLERYASSVDSIIHRDYQDLFNAFQGSDKTPVAFTDAEQRILSNPNYSLHDESRVNSVYRAIMCMVALKGAKDFRADDSIEFHTLDDHHIFPKAYLDKLKQADGSSYPSRSVNSILNRTLISGDTNRRISRMAPSNYLDKLVPSERIREIMASHFITDDALQAMCSNNFEAFLACRDEALKTEIRRQLTIE